MATKTTNSTNRPAAKPAPVPAKSQPQAQPAATKPVAAGSKALVEAKANPVPAMNDAFETMGGGGFENVTANDVIIPRLTILQALSPQVTKSKPEFIEGASAGQFCDTATNDIFDEMQVVPVFFARVYLEWAPRSTGKGLIRNHGTNSDILNECTPDEKNRMVLPNGNYIAETATFYCLNITAGGRRSFIPMTSTQLKAARRWMTQLTGEKLTNSQGREFTPPIFYRSWRATVVSQSNAEGDWFGWKFDPAETILELDPTKGLLAEAKEFYEQARDGLVKGDVETEAVDAAARSEVM